MNKIKELCIVFILLFVIGVTICYGPTSDPWDGTTWDVTAPDILQPIGNHYKELYDLRKGVGVRANKEHVTYATSSAGGEHKNGAAVAYEGTSTPSNRPDASTALANNAIDRGRLWIDDNYDPPVLRRWTGSAFTEMVAAHLQHATALELVLESTEALGTTDGTGDSKISAVGNKAAAGDCDLGYMLFSHDGTGADQKGAIDFYVNDGDDDNAPSKHVLEMGSDQLASFTGAVTVAGALTASTTTELTGNVTVNTDKVTITAASGNTAIAGTLDVTGALDPTTWDATNGGFIDEDSMATDSATKVPSQQSVKAYADGQVCRCQIADNDVLTASTWVTLDLDADSYDPDGISDLTNDKITPTVAGYYLVIASVQCDALSTSLHADQLQLYKNGSTSVAVSIRRSEVTSAAKGMFVSDIINFNGSSDYIQVRYYNGHASDAGAIADASNDAAWISIAWVGAG